MNLLSWNCRGLGNNRAVATLSKLLGLESPFLIFLIETKLYSVEIDALNKRFNFPYVISVNCDSPNRNGGLSLFCRESISVNVLTLTPNCIEIEILACSFCDFPWGFTGVYGWPRSIDRHKTWTLLCDIKDASSLPWICVGDFNEILWSHGKCGGLPKNITMMTYFREALDDCDLADLGYSGPNFTWCNNQQGIAMIRERLDRGLGNTLWTTHFPNTHVTNLPRIGSDHSPIRVEVDIAARRHRRGKLFRFEAAWL